MIGHPKFEREQLVTFTLPTDGGATALNGAIYIVDPYGTFEQNDEPSYDIQALYEDEIVLFKHIPESMVTERTE